MPTEFETEAREMKWNETEELLAALVESKGVEEKKKALYAAQDMPA